MERKSPEDGMPSQSHTVEELSISGTNKDTRALARRWQAQFPVFLRHQAELMPRIEPYEPGHRIRGLV